MNQKLASRSANKLYSAVLLFSLLFSNLSLNSARVVYAQTTTTEASKQKETDGPSEVIDLAIHNHNVDPNFDYLYSRISLEVEGNWAYADVTKLDKDSKDTIPTRGYIILAHVENGGTWSARLPEEGQLYNEWLDQIPSSLLDDLVKDMVVSQSSDQIAVLASATVSGHYLPWPAPIGARVTQNYNTHGLGQIDFVPDTSDIVATKDGTIVYVNDTHWKNGSTNSYATYNNVVVIRHSSSEYTIYLHLKQNSIPAWIKAGCPNGNTGQTCSVAVQRGNKVGEMGTTGYSTGNHLHLSTGSSFYVDTNNSDWADEDGDGNTSELTYTAFTTSHITADFVEYSYDILASWPNDPNNKVYSQNSSGGGNCNNPNPNSDQIGLYSDDNYCGTAKILGVGDYSNPSNMGFPNDSLSSIKVGSNVKTTLCKDDNYAGGCEDFTSDDSHLGDNGIGNDTVSSVKVVFKNNCLPNADQVAFYMDPNYSGTCVVKGIGNYPDPGSMGIANDSLSSIKVGSNVRLILYVDNDYQSTSETFTGDDSDLSNNTIGNDRASSAKVEARNNSLPSDYGYCADEGQTCAFSGTAQIYYGANNQFVGPVTKTDGVACTNDVFGDPIPGTQKKCYIKGGRPQGSTFCANEGGTCSFGSSNVATVYYGANGKYNTQTGIVSSIACNNSVFGDPFPTIGKACYYVITGSSISTPSNPSPTDNTTLSRTNNTVLSWNTNGTSCTIHIWGGNIDISPTNNCSNLQLGEQRGGAYNWQVTASNGSGSATGDIWHFNIKPYAPTNLTTSDVSASQVTLNWALSSDEPNDIDTYEIFQDDQYIGYVTKGISSYTVSGLTCDGSYSFYVKSKRQGVLSDASNTVNRGPVGCVPVMPSDVTVSNATLHSLTLGWQDNSNNESGFNIYRWGYDGVNWDFYYLDSVGANVTSYTQTGLVCGSDFNYYEISAYNANGESPRTSWVQGITNPCPDLTPNPRPGRADPVIASSIPGTTTNDTLYVGQPVYFDWGYTNLGNADVNSNYYVDLYIDDQRFVHYPFNSLGVGADGGFDDWSEIWNQPGWHTVKLVVDPDNTVDESNEDNNVWMKDFFWASSAPSNDDFDNVTIINSLPYNISLDTTGATQAGDDPILTCVSAQKYNTVWYQYAPSAPVNLTIDTIGSGYDTVLGVWTGSRGNLTSVGCNDDFSGLQSQVQLSASNGATYYIEVASYSQGGGNLTLNVTANPPNAFGKSTPTNGATGLSTSPTLTWESSLGAASYEYCYDTTNDNACSNWTSNGSSTSKALSGLSGGTTYFWHVRAINSGGTTYANDSSTAFWSFTTATNPPGAFIKSSPSNGATNQSTSPTLSWGSSTGATSYEYCYDTTNDNSCANWTSNGTSTSKALSGLNAGTTYYWHVRAINSGGTTYANGSSTAYWSFTTVASNVQATGAWTADGNWNSKTSFAPDDPIQWVITVENITGNDVQVELNYSVKDPYGTVIQSWQGTIIAETGVWIWGLSGTVPNIGGTYTFTGSVTYQGIKTEKTTTYTVTVVDENDAPTEINLSQSSVDENQPIGTTIGVLSTTDVDAGDTHTYSFCGGTDDASFSITGNALKTAAVFDFETKSSYSICIRSTDSGGLSTTKTFAITVNSLAEHTAPTDISLSNSNVDENQPVGTIVGTFSTTDSDVGDSHSYSFCGGTDDASFSITGNTLKTAAVFDYETKSSYAICIRSTDSGGLSKTKAFTVTVNNLVDTQTFSDVSTTYWAWQFIERLFNAGITGGCTTSPLSYCPESEVTRAQMAVFLVKGLHYPTPYTAPNVAPTFSDTVGHWAEDWIEALKNDGVTAGCAAGMYCPENPVTRAQMAVFLLKAKYGSSYAPPNVGTSTGFDDAPTDHWASAWIKQLALEQITGGCGGGNYCPESPVTRAQMAVFLVKTFNLP